MRAHSPPHGERDQPSKRPRSQCSSVPSSFDYLSYDSNASLLVPASYSASPFLPVHQGQPGRTKFLLYSPIRAPLYSPPPTFKVLLYVDFAITDERAFINVATKITRRVGPMSSLVTPRMNVVVSATTRPEGSPTAFSGPKFLEGCDYGGSSSISRCRPGSGGSTIRTIAGTSGTASSVDLTRCGKSSSAKRSMRGMPSEHSAARP